MHRLTVIFGLLFAFAPVAYAHPGHGATDGYQPLHYLIEPAHVGLSMVVIGLLVIAAGVVHNARSGRRKRR